MSRFSIVEPVGGHGGMTLYNESLVESIGKSVEQITLYSNMSDETTKISRNSVVIDNRFRDIFVGGTVKRAVQFFSKTMSCLWEIRCRREKIVHLHLFHFGIKELITIALAKSLKLKVVGTIHDVSGFDGNDISVVKAKVFQLLDGVIAHSGIAIEEIESYLSKTGIELRFLRKIKHGGHTHQVVHCEQAKAQDALGLDHAKKTLLFFGQIKDVKGLDVLLKSLSGLDQNVRSNIQVVIAGKVWRDAFNKYQKIIDEHKISDLVDARIEYIPESEVDLYYNAADIVVLPYKKIYQSGVLLMSMSYRKVVVSSDLPGMAEVIEDGKNGFLFKSESSESLASKLQEVLSLPQEALNEVSDNAYQTMSVDYCWDSIGTETVDFYNEIIGETVK